MEPKERCLALWIADIEQQLETDPITMITLSGLMAWMIRKTIPAEEIETIVDAILRRLRTKMIAEYDEAAKIQQDLQLPDREEFVVSMNASIAQSEQRLRNLLIGGEREIPGTDKP